MWRDEGAGLQGCWQRWILQSTPSMMGPAPSLGQGPCLLPLRILPPGPLASPQPGHAASLCPQLQHHPGQHHVLLAPSPTSRSRPCPRRARSAHEASTARRLVSRPPAGSAQQVRGSKIFRCRQRGQGQEGELHKGSCLGPGLHGMVLEGPRGRRPARTKCLQGGDSPPECPSLLARLLLRL